MRFATLSDWLDWQETLHPTEVDLGLARCRAVIRRMDWGAYPVVVSVAGTNGKGSTVAILDAVLSAAGWRVGTYTSPHLVRYNERVTVGGRAVPDETLLTAFDRLDRARGKDTLTYFEFGTLGAMDVFLRERVDAAILEVGIGGRLDAVNAFDADVAVVTTIDIDHVNWLGADRESIGREKAGIFRAGRPAVIGEREPPASVAAHARSLGATPYRLGAEFDHRDEGDVWGWRGGARDLAGLPPPALAGPFQRDNAAAALMAAELVRDRRAVPEAAIREGLRSVRLRGRFQVFPGPVERVVDVAHNPQATAALAANLERHPAAARTLAVVGMLADKDHRGALAPLAHRIDGWHLVLLDSPRTARPEDLAATLEALGARGTVAIYPDVAAGWAAAGAAGRPGDRILAFGSFYLAGDVLALLGDPL